MPVLSLACHLPHNTPNIPSRYNNEQTTKQTKAINNSYIYIYLSCKCDTNRAGHFTLDAYASRPVACILYCSQVSMGVDGGLVPFSARSSAATTRINNRYWDAFQIWHSTLKHGEFITTSGHFLFALAIPCHHDDWRWLCNIRHRYNRP